MIKYLQPKRPIVMTRPANSSLIKSSRISTEPKPRDSPSMISPVYWGMYRLNRSTSISTMIPAR